MICKLARALAGSGRSEAKILKKKIDYITCYHIVFNICHVFSLLIIFWGNLSLEEELDLTRGGTSRGRGRPALHQQSLHLERRRVEKRTLDYDVKPRAGSCRGAPMRARPDLPPRGWRGSPPPGRRAVATHKKASKSNIIMDNTNNNVKSMNNTP